MCGAGLEIARELDGNRVGQIPQGALNLARYRIRCRITRADQHQCVDPVRLRDRSLPRDEATERVADQGRALDPDGIEKSDDVARHFGNRVPGGWAIGVTEAAQVDGERTNSRGQQRQDAAEGEPGVGPAVQEDDRLPLEIAGFDVVQGRAVWQTDGIETNAAADNGFGIALYGLQT